MRKGDHTWPIELTYERCPYCGFINESRSSFQYNAGQYTKEVECGRCHKNFLIQKAMTRIGPIFGNGSPAEVDFDDD